MATDYITTHSETNNFYKCVISFFPFRPGIIIYDSGPRLDFLLNWNYFFFLKYFGKSVKRKKLKKIHLSIENQYELIYFTCTGSYTIETLFNFGILLRNFFFLRTFLFVLGPIGTHTSAALVLLGFSCT